MAELVGTGAWPGGRVGGRVGIPSLLVRRSRAAAWEVGPAPPWLRGCSTAGGPSPGTQARARPPAALAQRAHARHTHTPTLTLTLSHRHLLECAGAASPSPAPEPPRYRRGG